MATKSGGSTSSSIARCTNPSSIVLAVSCVGTRGVSKQYEWGVERYVRWDVLIGCVDRVSTGCQ